jgi:hypothetical protein
LHQVEVLVLLAPASGPTAAVKVQIVEAFPDLKVKVVDMFPDECGKWKFIDAFPDTQV